MTTWRRRCDHATRAAINNKHRTTQRVNTLRNYVNRDGNLDTVWLQPVLAGSHRVRTFSTSWRSGGHPPGHFNVCHSDHRLQLFFLSENPIGLFQSVESCGARFGWVDRGYKRVVRNGEGCVWWSEVTLLKGGSVGSRFTYPAINAPTLEKEFPKLKAKASPSNLHHRRLSDSVLQFYSIMWTIRFCYSSAVVTKY